MSVDLSQFHQVFLEESSEGLDIMEHALMELDPAAPDSETINAIFRAAHSIKGGSATFGFSAIAEFTHLLETLLDQVRDRRRTISSREVDLLLQAVDCMKEMLNIVKQGGNRSTPKAQELATAFQRLLDDEEEGAHKPSAESTQEATSCAWRLTFAPLANMPASGNDPLRILRALQELNVCKLVVDLTNVPKLAELDPEALHLSWQMELPANTTEAEIREVFSWVEDCADIDLQRTPEGEQLSGQCAWHVHFVPHEDVLKAGNDAVKLLQALKHNAPVTRTQVSCSKLPALKLMDPEKCYLSWDLQLGSGVSHADIAQAFEWVAGDSVVDIQSVTVATERTADAATPVRPLAAVPAIAPVGAAHASVERSPAGRKVSPTETSSIRVGIDKIDSLINMVGELVITQSMLGQLGADFDMAKIPKLLEGLSQLEQNTRELQENVMRIRMLPISFAFSRFPRMVRDVGQQLQKKIHLEMYGEQTELDKTVMEKIGDPLVHLVRNAMDHGIELPAERTALGKPETGCITLNAYHQGGNVVIEICDDGRGLDREKLIKKALEKNLLQAAEAAALTDEQTYELIFHPGFSTAQTVSDLSGRGVGMDVVRRNIQALNGVVEIHSKKGQGSTIRIRLPLTLAILDGQLVRVGGNVYVFPLVSIVESIQCRADEVSHIAGGCKVFRLRDDCVPIIKLHEIFAVDSEAGELDLALMVVVEADGEKVAVVVDELLAQQQVVIKSLEQNYRRIEGISGATILGDGTVALIVDMPGVVKLAAAAPRLPTAFAQASVLHH